VTDDPPRPGPGVITTPRLTIRPWRRFDAEEALAVYGNPDVANQLNPALGPLPDADTMRLVLEQWIAEDARTASPAGRWALRARTDGRLVGGATLLPLPPGDEDLEFAWHLHPDFWGQGYAKEAGRAVAHWAFAHDVEEIFAVVRPGNLRAVSVARRMGMEWVGETSKYYEITLQVYRLRSADLVAAEAAKEQDALS
jgi:RimJ/RimL family protein N-acetyltransferase